MGRRVGIAILLIAGALTVAAVAYGAARDRSAGLSMRASTPSYTVDLGLDRAATGQRLASIAVVDAVGRPVEAEAVAVVATMADMGHLNPPLQAVAEGEGRFCLDATLFTMSGRWEVDVAVRAQGRTETARFTLNVDL